VLPFALLALLVLVAPAAVARDLHVAEAAVGPGDGSVARPFPRIAEAMAASTTGDRILIGPGVYSDTTGLSVYGQPRLTMLALKDGVEIIGSGRGHTFLRAPDAPIYVLGISAEGVGRASRVSDLTVDGPCFHGIQLRSSHPVLERIEVRNPATGTSSLAMDVRDGSDPLCVDLVLDGGHSALFVEFQSAGTFRDCRIGRRPNEGLACSGADPRFERCTFDGAGRDLIVLNQNSWPRLDDCRFLAAGDRWTIRVAVGYSAGTTLHLPGNHWFTSDPDRLAETVHDARDDPQRGLTVELSPLGDPVPAKSLTIGHLKSRFLRPGE
jgi:hypothetical protein